MRFEYQFEREHGELFAVALFAAFVGIGARLHASLLCLFGALGGLSALTLYVWQRRCLVRLSYTRRLSAERVDFGGELCIVSELVNDKFLPLPWVSVEDEVPGELSIRNSSFDEEKNSVVLTQRFSMLPYQRTRRELVVTCAHRGGFRFGATTVTSGDPLGVQRKTRQLAQSELLVVYPKLFQLSGLCFDSRTPVGDVVTRRRLIVDPTRIAGVRTYRVGDPLRHVDWRGSARTGQLLVREFETTLTATALVFIDCGFAGFFDDESEFTIALGASLFTKYFEASIPTGLFASGAVDGNPVAHDPSSSPEARVAMLERLALLERPSVGTNSSLASMLLAQASRLRPTTTVVVVSSSFSQELFAALAHCRRRAPLTGVFVSRPGALAPPKGTFDVSRVVAYESGWQHRDHVVLAS